MNAVTIASVRKNLASLIDEVRCRKERVIITRHDKPVAALVPVDDAAFLDEFEDRLDLADALEAIEDYDANGASTSSASRPSSISEPWGRVHEANDVDRAP